LLKTILPQEEIPAAAALKNLDVAPPPFKLFPNMWFYRVNNNQNTRWFKGILVLFNKFLFAAHFMDHLMTL